MSFKVQPWEGAVTQARLAAQHEATAQLSTAKRERPKAPAAPRKRSAASSQPFA